MSLFSFIKSLGISVFFTSLFIISGLTSKGQVPDKASPFTAVKWESEKPVVQFEGDWFEFQSINNISVSTIIDFCKKTYESRWQKRFSEDMVEVLTNMGYTLSSQVSLVLSQNGTKFSKTGTMSEENRNRVRDYNNGEETKEIVDRTQNPNMVRTLSDNTSQQQLAQQMAEWMDKVWEEDPTENAANIRFLFHKDGNTFAGKIDINGDFVFRAQSRTNHTQSFNPNKNGRWVYEEIPPGTYNLSITGKNEFQGWSWTKQGVKITPNSKPLYEINLDITN